MQIDLTKGTWTKVTDLTDDTIYMLQGRFTHEDKFYRAEFLLTQSATEPTEEVGLLADAFKVKKVTGTDIYVMAVSTETTLNIEAVQ